MDKVEEMKAWLTEAALNAVVRIESMERIKSEKPFPNDDIFMVNIVVGFKSSQGTGCVWLHGSEIDNDQALSMKAPYPVMETLKLRWRQMMREAWKSAEGPPDTNAGDKS